jgi:DNA polymerase-1
MKHTLIIDTSALLYRAKHAVGNKLSHQDVETGLMFGFFIQIFKLANKFKTNRFIFCLDGGVGGKSIRKSIFPDYKRSRVEKHEEDKKFDDLCYKKFDDVVKLLYLFGFKNIHAYPGLEADDIVASFLMHNLEYQKGSIVVSSDNDFYQLLDICKGMFLSQKNYLYTKHDLDDEYGVTPEQWRLVKEIAGCKGDQVPGIPGVGYAKAAMFIRGDLVKGKVYDKIVSPDFANVRKLAKKLTSLPIAKTPKVKLIDDRYDLNFDPFLEMCSTYNFNSFISNSENFNGWRRFFEGDYGKQKG